MTMTNNETTGVRKELDRVRALKRAAQAENELLRSDMEKGVIHIRINPDIKPEIADALVEMYQLGYDSGCHTNYYTDGQSVYKESARPAWHNWGGVEFKMISLFELMSQTNTKYYSWDEFDNRDYQSCFENYQELVEEMTDKDYDQFDFFIKEEYPEMWEEFLEQKRGIAYEYFLGEIPDEYTVNITE